MENKNDILTIEINELSPGLNGKQGMLNMHWTKYTAVKKKWLILVMEQTRRKIEAPVALVYERFMTKQMDWDNLGASFKVVGDALVKAGVLMDDSPDIIKTFTLKQHLVRRPKDQRIRLTIKPLIRDIPSKDPA